MSSGEDDDTESAIMDATFAAVCSHGYARLTMQDIADEFDKSKSLLHYHYDTKEDLVVAFLDHLVDRFEDRVEELLATDTPPEARLREFIEWFALAPGEVDRRSLHLALLELRTQAPRNERFREPFARSDRVATTALAELLREGQDAGTFRDDVDAETLARLIFVAMDGARARQLTLEVEGYAAGVGETLATVIAPRGGGDP